MRKYLISSRRRRGPMGIILIFFVFMGFFLIPFIHALESQAEPHEGYGDPWYLTEVQWETLVEDDDEDGELTPEWDYGYANPACAYPIAATVEGDDAGNIGVSWIAGFGMWSNITHEPFPSLSNLTINEWQFTFWLRFTDDYDNSGNNRIYLFLDPDDDLGEGPNHWGQAHFGIGWNPHNSNGTGDVDWCPLFAIDTSTGYLYWGEPATDDYKATTLVWHNFTIWAGNAESIMHEGGVVYQVEWWMDGVEYAHFNMTDESIHWFVPYEESIVWVGQEDQYDSFEIDWFQLLTYLEVEEEEEPEEDLITPWIIPMLGVSGFIMVLFMPLFVVRRSKKDIAEAVMYGFAMGVLGVAFIMAWLWG